MPIFSMIIWRIAAGFDPEQEISVFLLKLKAKIVFFCKSLQGLIK